LPSIRGEPDTYIYSRDANPTVVALERAMASLEGAARDTALQTIVIDNASTDGSAAAVREAYPDVEVVERERRHGFGANHNEAIRRADGRYVLILNEDTVLHEGMLDRMCRFMDQNREVGAWGRRS
jgi:GT2 family glycosyltransferase